MNTFSLIASNLAAILLMLLGGSGMLFPKNIASFVGIQPIAVIGVSEIRATLGSFFLMLGATCLWLQSTDAFTVVAHIPHPQLSHRLHWLVVVNNSRKG